MPIKVLRNARIALSNCNRTRRFLLGKHVCTPDWHFGNFRGTIDQSYNARVISATQLVQETQLEWRRLPGTVFRRNRSDANSEDPTFDALAGAVETK
jgi:hypothetical protein